MKSVKVERYLLAIFVILYFLNEFFSTIFLLPLAFLSLIVLVITFHRLNKTFRWATVIFLIIAIILLIISHASLSRIANCMVSMDGFVVLLLIMQLFSIPIEIGHYQNSLIQIINGKIKSSWGLYNFTMLIAFVLASILSLGTIPLMYSILGTTIKQRVENDHRFSATAISRGYTMGTLWSPGAATIFVVASVTNESWNHLFLPSFLMGVLGLVLASLMAKKWITEPKNSQNDSQTNVNTAISKVMQVAIAIIILIIVALVLIHFKVGQIVTSVSISGLLIAGIWILLLQKTATHQETKASWNNYLNKGIFAGVNLAPFFIGIGSFSSAFQHSTIPKLLGQSIGPFLSHLGWGVLIIVPILIVILALVGIHPLVSIAILGQLLIPLNLPFSALALALALNFGGALSYMASPFEGETVIVGALVDESPSTVALTWNGVYGILLFIINLIFIIAYTLIIK